LLAKNYLKNLIATGTQMIKQTIQNNQQTTGFLHDLISKSGEEEVQKLKPIQNEFPLRKLVDDLTSKVKRSSYFDF
jgi:hypothetical protein